LFWVEKSKGLLERSMSRERVGWLVSIALLVVLAFQLPGTLAQRDDDYTWIRTLTEVHRQIYNNYVEPVNDANLKEKAIEGMLTDLDPYTNYIAPERQDDFDRMLNGSFKGVGIELAPTNGKVVVETPIEGGPADRAGIHSDDVIVKVNGESIAGLPIDDVSKKITGPVGTPVTITILRDGKNIDFTMKREQIVLDTVKGFNRTPDDSWNFFCLDEPKIGYIRIAQFDENTFAEVKSALEGSPPSPGHPGKPGIVDSGMKGLILDLRFNPGGRLEQAINIVNLFVKDGVIVTTRGRSRPEEVTRANGEGTLPSFPMIVLVNDKSASASEIVSGSLKDNQRALVVGQRTFGKGSVQEIIPLGDDSGKLKLTVAYYYLPSGRLVHRKKGATDWGVEPQVVVPLDDNGELAVLEQYRVAERIRRPKTTTRPATQGATQQFDPQLKEAVNTMIGLIVLDKGKMPTTMPTTRN
jgi:carboxyl-terminal processing protease